MNLQTGLDEKGLLFSTIFQDAPIEGRDIHIEYFNLGFTSQGSPDFKDIITVEEADSYLDAYKRLNVAPLSFLEIGYMKEDDTFSRGRQGLSMRRDFFPAVSGASDSENMRLNRRYHEEFAFLNCKPRSVSIRSWDKHLDGDYSSFTKGFKRFRDGGLSSSLHQQGYVLSEANVRFEAPGQTSFFMYTKQEGTLFLSDEAMLIPRVKKWADPLQEKYSQPVEV